MGLFLECSQARWVQKFRESREARAAGQQATELPAEPERASRDKHESQQQQERCGKLAAVRLHGGGACG